MLSPGFANPVHNAQDTFRTVLDALARPGLILRLKAELPPPAPLTPELAAIALTLTDADTPLWLDRRLSASPDVAAFLRFHAGVPLTRDPAQAAFALICDPGECPPFETFAQGMPAYPDTSTTLIVAFDSLEAGRGLALSGPGIRGAVRLAPTPLPKTWPAQLTANHARFPLGIDLILTAPGRVAGLPRSSAIGEG